MTVESTSRKQTYAGAQSSLTFSFRTLVNHPEYIKVLRTLISSGVETELTYNTDYTVSVNADGVGGVVTVSPTFSALYTMTVYRDTGDVQESDYDDFNQFPADTLEDDFDRRTLISQERSEDSDRTAKLPISSTVNSVTLPEPQDGYSLVWSGSSGKLINSNLVGPSGSTGSIGPSGASGSISLVSSSTSDVTVVSTSTTPIITAINAATGGASKILRLDASGKLPALDASQLTSIPTATPVLAVIDNVGQSVVNNTYVKRVLGTTTVDTGSYWSGNTYTPLIAGKYEVIYSDSAVLDDGKRIIAAIYKNGSAVLGNQGTSPGAGISIGAISFAVLSMNGTTDYIEFFVNQNSGGTITVGSGAIATVKRISS